MMASCLSERADPSAPMLPWRMHIWFEKLELPESEQWAQAESALNDLTLSHSVFSRQIPDTCRWMSSWMKVLASDATILTVVLGVNTTKTLPGRCLRATPKMKIRRMAGKTLKTLSERQGASELLACNLAISRIP